MLFGRTVFALLLVTAGLSNLSPAQERATPSPPRRAQGAAKARPAREGDPAGLQAVRSFVERASAFQDLQAKVATLANLGSLLWQRKGQEEYSRQIFLRLYDELKADAQAQSVLKTAESNAHADRALALSLQRVVLSVLARHDAKLAQKLLAEVTEADSSRAPRWSLNVANDLIRDGEVVTARAIVEPALQSELSDGDMYSLMFFLLNLHMLDADAGDALFLQVLGRMAARPRLSADDLLIVGNYLFMDDSDVSPNFMTFTPTKVENVYFVAGISGERSGLSREMARHYLVTAHAVLSRQMEVETTEPARKRYAVAARLLGLKAEKFAPELVNAFSALSQSVAQSKIMVIPLPGKQGAEKLIDFDAAKDGLEKIAGAQERDERALGLAATAYIQKDTDTAFKLSELISDETARARLQEIIAFRRAANSLEKGDANAAAQLAGKMSDPELRLVIDLGLAGIDLKEKNVAAALTRLQTILSSISDQRPEARALYLMSAAAMLMKLEPTLALQTLGEAFKAFNESDKGIGQLARREHLGRVKTGKKSVHLSVNTGAVQLGAFNEALVGLFRKSPQGTAALVLGLKNEKVSGAALVALAKEILNSKTPTPTLAGGQ